MIENMMAVSIFLTVACTFIVLGLLVFAAFYVFAEKIKEKRRAAWQKKIERDIELMRECDTEWKKGEYDE